MERKECTITELGTLEKIAYELSSLLDFWNERRHDRIYMDLSPPRDECAVLVSESFHPLREGQTVGIEEIAGSAKH